MNRLILLLLILSPDLFGQARSITLDGKESILLSVPDAAIVDYWARKGILSIPIMERSDEEVKLLESKIEFKDFIIDNCRKAQEEYRNMVYKNAQEVQRLNLELTKTREDLDEWRDKAKRRAEKLGIIAVAVATISAGFIFL